MQGECVIGADRYITLEHHISTPRVGIGVIERVFIGSDNEHMGSHDVLMMAKTGDVASPFCPSWGHHE